MASQFLLLPILATCVAVVAAGIGASLAGRPGVVRVLVPLSGGLLAGLAVFGLIPEMIREIGRARGLLIVAAGYASLMAFDRFVHPICPSCAYDHDHASCDTTLHGFAGPLLSAAAVHALLDGWGLVTVRLMSGNHAAAVTAGILLHKIPEGLALGTIVRSAVGRYDRALALVAAAELATVAGACVGLWLTPAAWLSYPLALAGGTFLFLGVHAVHGDWKRRGATPVLVPALAGAAGAALLQGLGIATR